MCKATENATETEVQILSCFNQIQSVFRTILDANCRKVGIIGHTFKFAATSDS